MNGHRGSDNLKGGAGEDDLRGGNGDDTLYGGAVTTRLRAMQVLICSMVVTAVTNPVAALATTPCTEEPVMTLPGVKPGMMSCMAVTETTDCRAMAISGSDVI